MQEFNINKLIKYTNELVKNIPNNTIFIGEIDILFINHFYHKLDLSKIKCNRIYYRNQEGESIKNHILPNSLIKLICSHNKLTSLPNLPNSLIELNCSYNKLTSPLKLPNSLQKLYCYGNKLTSLPELPN